MGREKLTGCLQFLYLSMVELSSCETCTFFCVNPFSDNDYLLGRERCHKKKQEICHCSLISCCSQTHSCMVTHTKSHKMDLHFSVATLQQIKSLVELDFLAVTGQTSLNKHAKDRISLLRLGFLTKM